MSVYGAIAAALLSSGLTLLGVFISNQSSYKRLKLTLDHEQKIKVEDRKVERLEELYVHSKRYLNTTVTYFFPYISVMKNEMTYNDALDQTIEIKTNYDPERVYLIMDMYFSSLRDDFKKVEEARDACHTILLDFKNGYKQGHFDKKAINKFEVAIAILTHEAQVFEEKISELAKNT
ncbi:hypothetical protein A6E10_19445 [Aliivibrio fischeri]|nr:hypothetical protein A6E10_19445 [Aliivibrio fischeri]